MGIIGEGVPMGKLPSNQRGYGYQHQRLRRALLADAIGRDCPHCGLPMLAGEPLDLDHTTDRNGYRGMAHASCNRSEGAKRGNAMRKAEIKSREW